MLPHDDRLAYLNVWLDGNHNGTWADAHQCPQDPTLSSVPEHIVIDRPVAVGVLGFDPPILSVPPGSVIAWVNVDGDYHATTSVTPIMLSSGVAATAVNDPWDSALLDSGEAYVHRLTEVGTYTYQDGENSGLTGQIVVEHWTHLPLVFRQYVAP